MITDSELGHRLRQNDREAFDVIVQRYQRGVLAFLRTRLISATDAEDLTQEVFLRFYQARDRFDPSSLIRPWLLGIARNLLCEHLRKLKQRREVAWTVLCLDLDDLLLQSPRETNEDSLAHLPQCVQELGQSAREAIELRYSGNLSLLDIGQRLKRSEGAIKLLMFRARQALKYCLDSKMRKSSP